jgi:hypothetical protein
MQVFGPTLRNNVLVCGVPQKETHRQVARYAAPIRLRARLIERAADENSPG